jgi:EmrB/QacA subfamily drug resistance transporter
MTTPSARRWLAFAILCCGDLMTVLDTTVVNVALPSIRADLDFSEAVLVWVMNAYMLTFGGFLLLGGRLGDLFGQRRLFLIGIAAFTLASVACGMAPTQATLVIARAAQGLGGAMVSALCLSIIMGLFPEPEERVRAMGYFGFVMAAGGSVGVLLGGLLTGALNWHWIFLINLPIGAAVFTLTLRFLPGSQIATEVGRLDVWGAITVTASLLLAIYAVVDGNAAGWTSVQTLGLLGASVALMAAFLIIEATTTSPLMPLGLFRHRNLSIANVAGVLWAASMFAWFFISALYMQFVLGYGPMQVGLAFLPANVIMGALSFSLSAKMVNRFGIRLPLAGGLFLVAVGLGLFALAPEDATFLAHVLPAMSLLGVGCGMALNPVMLAAMNDVEPSQSGLASGVVNTSFMMGGALGLAVLVSVAAGRTEMLIAAGLDARLALNGGYHVAFVVAAIFALVGAALGAFLRPGLAPGQPSAH